MTEDELTAKIKLPAGAKIELWNFLPETTIYSPIIGTIASIQQAASVICGLSAPNDETALEGAMAVLQAVDGLDVFMRVAPEADTIRDFATGEMVHRGYVRFSFFDRPGKRHDVSLRCKGMKYIRLK